MSRNIIKDGYTRNGYIAAIEHYHDELGFTYRPMLPDQTEVFMRDEFKQRAPKEATLLTAAALKGQLQSWTETDKAGKPEPITVENLAALPWIVFNRLFNIVAGFSGSDAPPTAAGATATAEKQGTYLAELMESMKAGVTPDALTRQADEKNSAPG
jgi:hypothetical protein